MSTALLIDVDVEAGVDLFDRVGAAMDSPRAALLKGADAIRDYEKSVFSSSGLGAWARDSAEWESRKSGGRTLVDTGGLLASLSSYPAKDAIQRLTGDSVTVATSAVAGIMAQRGPRGMPKRNPAPKPSSGQVQGWAETILGALLDQAGAR